MSFSIQIMPESYLALNKYHRGYHRLDSLVRVIILGVHFIMELYIFVTSRTISSIYC